MICVSLPALHVADELTGLRRDARAMVINCIAPTALIFSSINCPRDVLIGRGCDFKRFFPLRAKLLLSSRPLFETVRTSCRLRVANLVTRPGIVKTYRNCRPSCWKWRIARRYINFARLQIRAPTLIWLIRFCASRASRFSRSAMWIKRAAWIHKHPPFLVARLYENL